MTLVPRHDAGPRGNHVQLSGPLQRPFGVLGAVETELAGFAFDDGLQADGAVPHPLERRHGGAAVVEVQIDAFVTMSQ